MVFAFCIGIYLRKLRNVQEFVNGKSRFYLIAAENGHADLFTLVF